MMYFLIAVAKVLSWDLKYESIGMAEWKQNFLIADLCDISFFE